jgi:hypothetical protein
MKKMFAFATAIIFICLIFVPTISSYNTNQDPPIEVKITFNEPKGIWWMGEKKIDLGHLNFTLAVGPVPIKVDTKILYHRSDIPQTCKIIWVTFDFSDGTDRFYDFDGSDGWGTIYNETIIGRSLTITATAKSSCSIDGEDVIGTANHTILFMINLPFIFKNSLISKIITFFQKIFNPTS